MTQTSGHFGIVVSGGPAPGINSVIASVAIEADNRGYAVFGVRRGFRGAVESPDESIFRIEAGNVTRIAGRGGSVLGTSRFDPLQTDQSAQAFRASLRSREIDKLVVIGGDGSAYLSHQLSRRFADLSIAHVPKTIDNDLMLPNNVPSFGFETARSAGMNTLRTLAEDARTTGRWFLVTSMGRKAGFLALGLGVTGGATLTLIPEEFEGATTPRALAEIVLGSIEKRHAMGRPHGIVVLAEGLLDKLDESQVEALRHCPRDEMGRLRHAEVHISDLVADELRPLMDEAGVTGRVVVTDIGYELRCHPPTAFDVEYTRFLGYGAVCALVDGRRDIMVVRDIDNLSYVPLADLAGEGGVMRTRTVDLESDTYRAARSYMIR